MVYGNLGETSGTGVLFTRNPSTGENKLYGEYLINAQGEDVVAGIRTPQPIAVMASELPKAFAILQENCNILEREYQDIMVPFLFSYFNISHVRFQRCWNMFPHMWFNPCLALLYCHYARLQFQAQ